ncbi:MULTISPECIES: hypothetical protein [unclassified Streptomyces]|uniref:hypothetical protein n=1 Tax=unclassified Streptomyces TaxID=2593676 RepID=UPI0037239C16
MAAHSRDAYANWRPPIIGVTLVIPVGADCLTVVDLHGLLMLPVGNMRDGQTAEEAAQRVLRSHDGLPQLRRIAIDQTQMRRRKVTTHILAYAPTTRAAVESLTFRDPRADVRVIPTLHFIEQAGPKSRLRVRIGLQALAAAGTAFIDAGTGRTGILEEFTG